jgi:hypothetical protein
MASKSIVGRTKIGLILSVKIVLYDTICPRLQWLQNQILKDTLNVTWSARTHKVTIFRSNASADFMQIGREDGDKV